jgi:hypothetical protein
MSENTDIQRSPITHWDELPNIVGIVTDVLLNGCVFQLLPECDATVQLLRATDMRQSLQLKQLFADLVQNHKAYRYPIAVTWLAFSYTCLYIKNLNALAGVQDDIEFLARKAALAEVSGRRGDLLGELVEKPGCLFVGADKWVSDLFSATKVVKGRYVSTPEILQDCVPRYRHEFGTTTWQPVVATQWQQLCGPRYKLMRFDMTGLPFAIDGQQIMMIEALLDNDLVGVGKTVQKGCTILADKTRRLQSYGNFAQRLTGDNRAFPGDMCEYDTANMPTQTAGDAHWQDKTAEWRLTTGGNRATYYGEVHPKIAQYVLGVTPLLPDPANITILDIAGGNGDLGERIIKELSRQFPKTRLNYLVVDYSQADVDVAKDRFGRMKLPPTCRVEAGVLCRDMFAYGYDAKAALADFGFPGGVDIIINSGGLLNNQIGSDLTSPQRFNHMFCQMLRPGGFGVYSGLTPLLVNAATHHEQGLQVINLYDGEVGRQMHVVQRPH